MKVVAGQLWGWAPAQQPARPGLRGPTRAAPKGLPERGSQLEPDPAVLRAALPWGGGRGEGWPQPQATRHAPHLLLASSTSVLSFPISICRRACSRAVSSSTRRASASSASYSVLMPLTCRDRRLGEGKARRQRAAPGHPACPRHCPPPGHTICASRRPSRPHRPTRQRAQAMHSSLQIPGTKLRQRDPTSPPVGTARVGDRPTATRGGRTRSRGSHRHGRWERKREQPLETAWQLPRRSHSDRKTQRFHRRRPPRRHHTHVCTKPAHACPQQPESGTSQVSFSGRISTRGCDKGGGADSDHIVEGPRTRNAQ